MGRTIGQNRLDLQIIALLSGHDSRDIIASTQALSLGDLLIRDGLTGLYNREYMRVRLGMEEQQAVAEGLPLSVIMIDLNHFKQINDTLGHAVGDRLLQAAAGAMRATLGEAGVAARSGGDEFLVVLPATSGEGAEAVARDLHTAMGQVRIELDGGRSMAGIAASLGVAAFPADAGAIPALLQAADEAMFRAKRRGSGIYRAGQDPGALPVPTMPALPFGVATVLAVRALPRPGAAESTRIGQPDWPNLARSLIGRHRGVLVPPAGLVFSSEKMLVALFQFAADAVTVTIALAQLTAQMWNATAADRLVMALHTGPVGTDAETAAAVDRTIHVARAAHGGQVVLTQTTAERITEVLPPGKRLGTLGLHRFGDLGPAEAVFQIQTDGPPPAAPPLRSLNSIRHNLPVLRNRFIGRADESARIIKDLANHQVVTLAGTGGAGKTRLALQVAGALAGDFPGGIWLVDLAPLADPQLVVQAVVTAMGLRGAPGVPVLQVLHDALAGQRLLLVLDNCEHLRQAVRQLCADLVPKHEQLRILATSRTPLRSSAEAVVGIQALPLPAHWKAVTDLRRNAAVQLLLDRLAAVRPGHELTAAEWDLAGLICRRLDGLPLAIELAAARGRFMDLHELAARLDDRFHLAISTLPEAGPRHRTLRLMVQWSYDLLSPQEQLAWGRLAVFAGSFSADAAVAVAGFTPTAPEAVADLVALLQGWSILQVEEHAEGDRYRMLETLRQFGLEALARSGAGRETRSRHRNWFLELAVRAGPELKGPDQIPWMQRLDRDLDNVRAALDGCQPAGEPEPGLRLASSLGLYWERRGLITEGLGRLEALLASAPVQTTTRVDGLLAAGHLAHQQGDAVRSLALYEEALAAAGHLGAATAANRARQGIGVGYTQQGRYPAAAELLSGCADFCRHTGDTHGLATATLNLGMVAYRRVQYPEAEACYREALACFEQVGDRFGSTLALRNLALLVSSTGKLPEAMAEIRALCQRGMAICAELGDELGRRHFLMTLASGHHESGQFDQAAAILEEFLHGIEHFGALQHQAKARQYLGLNLMELGRYAEAEALCTECLAWFERQHDRMSMSSCSFQLGEVHRRMGAPERAEPYFRTALRLQLELSRRIGVVIVIRNCAYLLADQGALETAARLLGFVVAEQGRLGARRTPPEIANHERFTAPWRARLGAARWNELLAAGAGLSLAEAVAQVLGTQESTRLLAAGALA